MSKNHRRTHSREWKRIADKVLDRDGYRCRECGKAGRMEVHHVVELQAGGTNDLGNLKALCRGCHIAAHRKEPLPGQTAWEGLVSQIAESR